jgi:hypothetical protein
MDCCVTGTEIEILERGFECKNFVDIQMKSLMSYAYIFTKKALYAAWDIKKTPTFLVIGWNQLGKSAHRD